MRKKKSVQWFPLTEPERVLFFSSSIWNLADGMLGPLFAVFTAKVGGDILEITWAWSVYLAVTGVGMIAVGRLGDRVGHHMLSVLGYAMTPIFTFGYLFVESPFDLFIIQAGLGLGLAFSNPTWAALYDKYSGKGEHDGVIWGWASAGGYLAQACAVLMGGLIVTYASFDTLFIIMGCISTLAFLYQTRILKFVRRH